MSETMTNLMSETTATASTAIPFPELQWQPADVPHMPAVDIGRWRTDGSATLATIQFITEAEQEVPAHLVEHFINAPVLRTLKPHVENQDGVSRFRSLRKQRAEAHYRTSVGGATVAALRAQRDLLEIEAKPGFAAKLLQMDRDIEQAEHAAAIAADEFHIIDRAATAATLLLMRDFGQVAADLQGKIAQALRDERQRALREAEAAIQVVVTQSLSKVVMLNNLLERCVPDAEALRETCFAIMAEQEASASPEPEIVAPVAETAAEAVLVTV